VSISTTAVRRQGDRPAPSRRARRKEHAGGTRAGFWARTEINRDDYGANWNIVLETGGLLIGKHVQIELEIEAVLRTGL
jgi:hypothetical protein